VPLFYRLGSALGYYLLDGDEIVYFGLFDRETPREIAFRLKLLLQNLHLTRARLATDPNITVDQVASARRALDSVGIEILVSDDTDRDKIGSRVQELTASFHPTPWELLTMQDVEARIHAEYQSIGDL
jgi:hypothetical protein